MMSGYLIWLLVARLTGSPLGAALVVVLAAYFAQRYSFGFGGLAALRAWRRISALERVIANNPHDRSARFELAEILLTWRRYRKAADYLRPCLERDHDDDTLYVMGTASYGAGDTQTAERLLREVADRSPDFRQGAVWLELGRGRLAHGDAAGARDALGVFIEKRTSTIEGRYLLGRALARLGDMKTAALLHRQAWSEYAQAPVFQKRRERIWAYRANPVRLAGVFVLIAGVATASYLVLRSASQQYAVTDTYEEEE